MNSQIVLSLLLRLYPHAAIRSDIARSAVIERIDIIVAACHVAGLEGVACAPVIATCFVESGLRSRHSRAPLCGCQPYHTDDATQARCAARSWRTSLARCASRRGAITRYGYGLCRVPSGRRFRRARREQSRRADLVTRLTQQLENRDGHEE